MDNNDPYSKHNEQKRYKKSNDKVSQFNHWKWKWSVLTCRDGNGEALCIYKHGSICN